MIRACLLGLICIAICAPSANSEDTAGIVKEITGDLAYVFGLNGAATMGANCRWIMGQRFRSSKNSTTMLVARVVEENGSPVKVSDRIRVVTTQILAMHRVLFMPPAWIKVPKWTGVWTTPRGKMQNPLRDLSNAIRATGCRAPNAQQPALYMTREKSISDLNVLILSHTKSWQITCGAIRNCGAMTMCKFFWTLIMIARPARSSSSTPGRKTRSDPIAGRPHLQRRLGLRSGKPKDTGTTKDGRLRWRFHLINCDLRTKKMPYGALTWRDLLPAKPNQQH